MLSLQFFEEHFVHLDYSTHQWFVYIVLLLLTIVREGREEREHKRNRVERENMSRKA